MRKRGHYATNTVRCVVLILALLFFGFPLYWLVITAFKPLGDILSWPPVFFPIRFTLDNFIGVPDVSIQSTVLSSQIIPYLRNSIIIALISMAVSTFILGPMAAYAITRYKAGGRLFPIWVLTVRATPLIGIAVPYLFLFRDLGILDSWWALIIVHLLANTAFATWMLIGFFHDIPREIDEAALIDGYSRLGAFFRIILLLAKPGLVVTAIFTFNLSWNHFTSALLFASTPRAQTIPVFVAAFRTLEYPSIWGVIAASGLVAIIPSMIFATLTLKRLVTGLTMGAVKG